MALITDGGALLKLPYTKDYDKWMRVAASSGNDGFYIIGNETNVTQTQGQDFPPVSEGVIPIQDNTWMTLFDLKLYKRVFPPEEEPQIPHSEPTDDFLRFEWASQNYHIIHETDPYQSYIKDGQTCDSRLRVSLIKPGENPQVLTEFPANRFVGIYDISAWMTGWIYSGDGFNKNGIGGIYRNNIKEDGTVDTSIDELFCCMLAGFTGFRRQNSPNNVEFRVNIYVGVGVNLTHMGYTLNFIDTDENPYIEPEEEGDGYSGTGGGNGDHDKSSDTIDVPPDPTISATQCGFVTLYNPTIGQVNALASQINSETFFETLKNFFEHAQDYVAGLAIIPVQPTQGASVHPKMGWFTLDVAMPLILSQYVTVDCGSINVKEFYGSSFDYSPLTRLMLYLPYIGYVNLNTDEVMDKTLQVKYKVDVYNGNCVAFVLAGGSIIGQYNGNCMQEVPVSSVTFDNVIRNSITLAAQVGGALVGMGQGVGALAGALGGLGGNQSAQSQIDIMQASAQIGNAAGGAIKDIGSGLIDIMASKPTITRSGSLGSSLGLMSVQKPHLIKIVPKQSLPKAYSQLCGYPSNITCQLSELTGYVQVDKIHISGITGTDAERSEIINILNGGVLI